MDLLLLAIPVFFGWAVSFSLLEPIHCNDGERWGADL